MTNYRIEQPERKIKTIDQLISQIDEIVMDLHAKIESMVKDHVVITIRVVKLTNTDNIESIFNEISYMDGVCSLFDATFEKWIEIYEYQNIEQLIDLIKVIQKQTS